MLVLLPKVSPRVIHAEQDEGVADLNMSCNRKQWYVVDQHCCRHDSPSVCLPLQRNEGWDIAAPMTGQHDDRDGFGMEDVACWRQE